MSPVVLRPNALGPIAVLFVGGCAVNERAEKPMAVLSVPRLPQKRISTLGGIAEE
jgi:hypothetical protein